MPLLPGAQVGGYIEIKSEPGLQVFLDGTFKGTTKTEVGGLILENVPAGDHPLRIVKENFNPQEAVVPVRAGDVFTFVVRPFTPKLRIEQSGSGADKQVVQKTGSLLLQTLPSSCEVSIPGAAMREQKTTDRFRAGDFPVGRFTATLSGLGKSVRVDFEVRDGEETHLFVNLLTGAVENKSKWAVAQPPSALPPTPAPPTPKVIGPSAAELTPQAVFARALADASAVESEIAKLDTQLKAGGNLDHLAGLVQRRNELDAALAAARAKVRETQLAVAAERQREFEADYAKFTAVRDTAAVPQALKISTWQELVKKWRVTGAGDQPAKLVWRDGRADVARGKVTLRVAGQWPPRFGYPSIMLDGTTKVEPPRDGGPSLTGLTIHAVSVARHTLRIEHPAVETAEIAVEVMEDKEAEAVWTPRFLTARLQLKISAPADFPAPAPGGARLKPEAVFVDHKLLLPDAAGLLPVPSDKEVNLLVLVNRFLPATAKARSSAGLTQEVAIALQPLPESKPDPAQNRTVPLERNVTLDLVHIPRGTFVTGALPRDERAGTLAVVTFSRDFWLGRTEVTQAQWTALGMRNRSANRGDHLPAQNVTWEEAMDFCRKLTAREQAAGRLPAGHVYTLPTDTQWQYAARAGQSREFAADPPLRPLDPKSKAPAAPAAVVPEPVNAWGLHGMAANVSEWCLEVPPNQTLATVTDPVGIATGPRGVLRLRGRPNFLRFAPIATRAEENGLRVALVPEAAK